MYAGQKPAVWLTSPAIGYYCCLYHTSELVYIGLVYQVAGDILLKDSSLKVNAYRSSGSVRLI